MSPDRAILPMTPEPGSTNSRLSSKTTVSPRRWTVGPLFMAVLPAVTTVIPLLPPSEDPMASVITMWGRCSKNWSLTGREQGRRRHHRQQGRQVVVRTRLVEALDQRLSHGVARDHHRVHLFLVDQSPHVVGVELRHEHDLRTDE